MERLDDGAWRFSKPNGESLVDVLPQHTHPLVNTPSQHQYPSVDAIWHQLVAGNRERGLEITPNTAVTRWLGERMDFGLAIDALISRSKLGGTWPPPRKHDSAESRCG